jgi:SNF2 family DNA or RNA helicase
MTLRSLGTDELPLPSALRRYQLEGVTFLTQRDAALLADGMGLGKTVQAATALRLLLRRPDARRALVVVPTSLRLNWQRELAKWAPELAVRLLRGNAKDRWATYSLPIPVIIASYDQVRADLLTLYSLQPFDVVLLDEAQKIRNSSSTTSLACKLVPRRRSWAMTGTPLENRLDDLVSVYDFVSPRLLSKNMSTTQVHRLIQPGFLRREKADVLKELPPIISQEIAIDLTLPQLAAYDELRDQAAINGASSQGELLALITHLKQVCNYDPASGQSAKKEAILTFAESWTGPTDKIIIFSQYVETLEWLQAQIDSIPTDIYSGKLSDVERDAMLRRFEGTEGPRALLMSLQAGGLGLNLNCASMVVLYDRWWNPAVEDQAIARAHRFGRSAPLHVIQFLTVGTVEERIAEIMTTKRALFLEYVEGAESAEIDHGLSRSELMRILDLPIAGPQQTVSAT